MYTGLHFDDLIETDYDLDVSNLKRYEFRFNKRLVRGGI